MKHPREKESELFLDVVRVRKRSNPTALGYCNSVFQASRMVIRENIIPDKLLGEVSLVAGGPVDDAHPDIAQFGRWVENMSPSSWGDVVGNFHELAIATNLQRSLVGPEPGDLVDTIGNQAASISGMIMPLWLHRERGEHVLRRALMNNIRTNLHAFQEKGILSEQFSEGDLGEPYTSMNPISSANKLICLVAQNWSP